MGKGARIRAMHKTNAQEQADPKIKASININLMEDDKVSVSGPIADPVFVMNLLGGALQGLTQFYLKQRQEQSRIVRPVNNLVLPRAN